MRTRRTVTRATHTLHGESSTVDIGEVETAHYSNYRGKGHRQGAMRGRFDAKEFIAWDGEGTAINEPITHEFYGEVMSYEFDDDRYTLPEEQKAWEVDLDAEPAERMNISYQAKPQPYVLLANSTDDDVNKIVSDEDGLSTFRCLEFMLNTKARHPDSIFVGFGFGYDINQILCDVPIGHPSFPEVKDEHGTIIEEAKPARGLWEIYETGQTWYSGYWIKWVPRKTFQVSHGRGKEKRSFILYDVFSYFQKSFLETCKDYLGKDDPDLAEIDRGKQARQLFKYEELDDFIIPYNRKELEMLVRVMIILRQDLHSIGIDPRQWYGPGAIADVVLKQQGIVIPDNVPKEVHDAAQYAYAGGWFEQFYVGRYAGSVYEYDIHSAYPAAAIHLPDLSKGYWEYVTAWEPGTFGVWHLSYVSPNADHGGHPGPEPFYCRSENGSISHPYEVQGWYWTPEASFAPHCVREGWVFRPETSARPFAFIEAMYEQRRVFKSQGNPAERALKLVLNSLYGKLAQAVGWDQLNNKAPKWHQFEWAGYITSYTRAMIYQAAQTAPQSIIAVETDALFSTLPLDLPLSGDLGDWELKTFSEITYIQSGFYYAIEEDGDLVCKYRGMDHDRNTRQPLGLPYERVLDHLAAYTGHQYAIPDLPTQQTRFNGLALGLRTSAVWRSWKRSPRFLSIDDKRHQHKRYHDGRECPKCIEGVTMYHSLHPMYIGGYSGTSKARALPWREVPDQAPLTWEEWAETQMGSPVYGDIMELFQ